MTIAQRTIQKMTFVQKLLKEIMTFVQIQKMKFVYEEIFGPVVVAAPFEDIDSVIARGNDTEYGLAASVWTKDINKAHKVAKGLKAGTVWVNCHNIFDAAAPFGGYKRSGFGREMGIHALENYTQVKNVIIQLNN